MSSKVNLGIAWSNSPNSYSYESTIMAAKETNANIVMLDMIKSNDLKYDDNNMILNEKGMYGILSSKDAKLIKSNTWKNSNIEEIMKGIDCVIVPGGVDISPTLFHNEQAPHGIEGDSEYSAERDVSDYLLISYCLDKDIPILCICRGMQMLSVVSGADIIQDLDTYFKEKGIEYNNIHRDIDKKVFNAHEVDITSNDSLIYKIMNDDILEGCPSWHHQAVGDVSNTPLTITGTTNTNGIPIVEVVERKDKSFCLGVQFHPEISVRKKINNEDDYSKFMDYDTVMLLFNALINHKDYLK